ncbi:hypothetical protein [Mesorhizobium marinum]|uniref:hypothetical protein n=1 Tax=Mesorhizobium marinum TaxID=3228790 RepID=UPI0034652DE1
MTVGKTTRLSRSGLEYAFFMQVSCVSHNEVYVLGARNGTAMNYPFSWDQIQWLVLPFLTLGPAVRGAQKFGGQYDSRRARGSTALFGAPNRASTSRRPELPGKQKEHHRPDVDPCEC